MGPREALEQISAMIKGRAWRRTTFRPFMRCLREMQGVTERAIGSGTLRRAKLVRMAKAG